MALHEGQLSLLELDQGLIEPLTSEPRNGRPPDATCDDDAAEIIDPAECREGEPGAESATNVDRRGTAGTGGSHRVANRQPRRSPRDESRARSDILEKHYKTREVAELLSVHEETVLRLAQCGRLRSVRVGSERRYPESAIVAFLERNTDETARRLRVAGRRV